MSRLFPHTPFLYAEMAVDGSAYSAVYDGRILHHINAVWAAATAFEAEGIAGLSAFYRRLTETDQLAVRAQMTREVWLRWIG